MNREDTIIQILIDDHGVSRETIKKLKTYADLVIDQNRSQNLIAKSTEDDIWNRHILDSAQLVGLAPNVSGSWLDVGSGAGFPGVVTALMTQNRHMLVEPRRKRADFLKMVTVELGIEDRVDVLQREVHQVKTGPVAVITARAFASLSRTIEATLHLGDAATVWLLHKGRTAAAEIDEARIDWSGHLEAIPSVTDPEAAIVRVSGMKASGMSVGVMQADAR